MVSPIMCIAKLEISMPSGPLYHKNGHGSVHTTVADTYRQTHRQGDYCTKHVWRSLMNKLCTCVLACSHLLNGATGHVHRD